MPTPPPPSSSSTNAPPPSHPSIKIHSQSPLTSRGGDKQRQPGRRRSRFAGPRLSAPLALGLLAVAVLICREFAFFGPVARSVVQKSNGGGGEGESSVAVPPGAAGRIARGVVHNATAMTGGNFEDDGDDVNAVRWNGLGDRDGAVGEVSDNDGDIRKDHIGNGPGDNDSGGSGDGNDNSNDEDGNDEDEDEEDNSDGDGDGDVGDEEAGDAAEENDGINSENGNIGGELVSDGNNNNDNNDKKGKSSWARRIVANARLFLKSGRAAPDGVGGPSGNKLKSPACHPHFQHFRRLDSDDSSYEWEWSNTTKFTRLYFYHARKAGGTSLANYFKVVAAHHGLEYTAREWVEAEEPGTYQGEDGDDDGATLYVTHLREPVDRAISHFKYQGRWDCKKQLMNKTCVTSESNANKLETWNRTSGHNPLKCKKRGGSSNKIFFLHQCASECYSQWFSGLSCPHAGLAPSEWYDTARAKLMKYNFVLILEKLKDPGYVDAVERLFGVPGLDRHKSAFCEKNSHKANKAVPLVVRNDTLRMLRGVNEFDMRLYEEISECLEEGHYVFPRADPDRFASHPERQVPYQNFTSWQKAQIQKIREAKARKMGKEEKEKKMVKEEKEKKKKKKKHGGGNASMA